MVSTGIHLFEYAAEINYSEAALPEVLAKFTEDSIA